MNKRLLIGIIIIVIIGGAFVLMHKQSSVDQMNMTQPQKSSVTAAKPIGKNFVTIQNFAFSPATITIKKGQSITWTNEDSAGHSATADDNSWDTGFLPQGQSKTLAFNKVGTFTYHCSVHPNMKATVTVQ
jgi:plastocyanin